LTTAATRRSHWWRAVAAASLDALDRRQTPRDREVAERQSRRTYTGDCRRRRSESPHPLPPDLDLPAPPSHRHQHGEAAHSTSAEMRARRRQQLDGEAPENNAIGGESHHLQTPNRLHLRPDAASRET
jgi:hypothetical protein